MILRVYATFPRARAAFDGCRGVLHDFGNMEVLQHSGLRIKFAAVDGLRGAEYLQNYHFESVEILDDEVPDKVRPFLLRLART